MVQWEYERTYSGVPQGSGVTPVLCNIYLNELDKFMEKYAIDFNTKPPRKRLSPAYKTSVNRAYEYRNRVSGSGSRYRRKKGKSEADV